jgi:hypothetical protein
MSDIVWRARTDWRRWRGLPPADRGLLVGVLAFLPAVAAALRVLGLRRVCRILSRAAATGPCDRPEDAGAAQAVGRLVDIAARRGVGRPTCLARSVTLWWLLRRRGIDSTLRIGVRTVEGRMEAHAWVEHAGLVLNEADDVGERFAPFEERDPRR